jgi:hypothetical protein
MRTTQRILAVAALALAVPLLSGHGDEPKKVSGLMRRKLENSQKVLEGLALNDFKAIARHAEELIAVSKEVEWKVIKTPQYEIHSNDFRRIADSLATKARDKNLDGAALDYVELTLTCIRCHKYVREVRDVRWDGEGAHRLGF